MALKSSTLQQLSLKPGSEGNILNISLNKKGEFTIYKIFTDPTGRHTIITTTQGDNFYLYEGWPKARHLPKRKMIIESVAWNPNAISSSPSPQYPRTSTREILLGDRNGGIYETLLDAHEDIFRTPDRYVQSIYAFPDRQPVTGLHSEFVPGSNRVVVLATSPSRLYQFTGNVDRRSDETGKLYEPIFIPYRDSTPSMYSCNNTVVCNSDPLLFRVSGSPWEYHSLRTACDFIFIIKLLSYDGLDDRYSWFLRFGLINLKLTTSSLHSSGHLSRNPQPIAKRR